MKFETPQFIEVEDKIFGPFTFKQFVYMIGGGALSYVWIKLVPSPFGWVLAIPTVVFALALAFYKVNTRPFVEVLQNFVSYLFKPKLYIWKKDQNVVKKAPEQAPAPTAPTTPISHNKNPHDLAQSLDILDPEERE